MIYLMIGRRVRDLRESKRMTQAKLAEISGLSRTSITNLEAGVQRAPLETLYALAKTFNVEIGVLLPTLSTLKQAEKFLETSKLKGLTHSKRHARMTASR